MDFDLTQTIVLGEIHGSAEKVYFGPVDRKQTALVIIDMQGKIGDSPSDLERCALSGSERILQSARENRIPVLHVILGCWTLDGRDFETFMQIESETLKDGKVNQSYEKGLWDTPNQQIYPSLTPQRGEIILKKTSASAFATTGIATILHNMGIRELVFCGKQTDGCCGFTAAEAVSHGFLITMVGDACSARSKAGHLAMLRIIQQHIGRVRTTDQMVQEFDGSA